MELEIFSNLPLRGGLLLRRIGIAGGPLTDAIGRVAEAKTVIEAGQLDILLRPGLSEEEKSISIFHEVLEGTAVGTRQPPMSVWDFNEADFERTAQEMHRELGQASPERLIDMLIKFGF